MIETTDFNKSEQYTLSIRLSTDGFSFSVFNPLGDGEFSYYDREVDASRSFPWSSSRTNKRKSFSITTILNGKTKPYNTTYCIRTALSYCSAWIRVPAPSFANSIPMSSSIPKPAPSLSSSPQRAAWATTGRCMHTCEKMP